MRVVGTVCTACLYLVRNHLVRIPHAVVCMLPHLVRAPGLHASSGQGVLHLVDLAGSERLDRSCVGNDAQRLRETQNINKSLSCLADVFAALSAKSSHVPYRNSKLTYLMQVRPSVRSSSKGDGRAARGVVGDERAAGRSVSLVHLRARSWF